MKTSNLDIIYGADIIMWLYMLPIFRSYGAGHRRPVKTDWVWLRQGFNNTESVEY